MEDTIHIAILAGTTRPKRRSINAARLVAKIGEEREDVSIAFVDPVDFTFSGDGNDEEGKDPKYTEITRKADGFFMVVPEYNHSFPGSLKRMIDSELANYIHKPVAFAGVSNGPWGGVRGVESMVGVVRELGLVATHTDVQFPNVSKIFDESGKLLDDAYVKRVNRAYDELVWMAIVLKSGRANIPSKYHER